MSSSRAGQGFLLLVALAALGAVIVYFASWTASLWRTLAELPPVWQAVYGTIVGIGAALLIGSTAVILYRLWRRTRRKVAERAQRAKNPSQLSSSEQEHEIDENLAQVERLRTDDALPAEVREKLNPLLADWQTKRHRQTLEIVAFGTISSGKSSLLCALAGRDLFVTDPRGGTTLTRNEIPWPGDDRVILVDTPGLGEVEGRDRAATAAAAARDADLVLVVVDGPLRESEHLLLEQLAAMEKRIFLCLNKEDWYDGDEQSRLLGQLRRQTQGMVQSADVLAVRSRPTERVRVRVLPDGNEVQETAAVPPNIAPLAERMLQVVSHDGRDLLLANLLLQSRGMVDQAKEQVRAALDRRAWQTVDQYMWGAGGAAAISPFPIIDLAAGIAISSKMVVELARVYGQDFDMNAAVRLLGQLSKNLLAILGTSAATPAVTAAVASMLKTVPGVGTLAGGVLQGLVQALVTRWIGAVFIEYFKNEMQMPEASLASLARQQWNRLTSLHELRRLVASVGGKALGPPKE